MERNLQAPGVVSALVFTAREITRMTNSRRKQCSKSWKKAAVPQTKWKKTKGRSTSVSMGRKRKTSSFSFTSVCPCYYRSPLRSTPGTQFRRRCWSRKTQIMGVGPPSFLVSCHWAPIVCFHPAKCSHAWSCLEFLGADKQQYKQEWSLHSAQQPRMTACSDFESGKLYLICEVSQKLMKRAL